MRCCCKLRHSVDRNSLRTRCGGDNNTRCADRQRSLIGNVLISFCLILAHADLTNSVAASPSRFASFAVTSVRWPIDAHVTEAASLKSIAKPATRGTRFHERFVNSVGHLIARHHQFRGESIVSGSVKFRAGDGMVEACEQLSAFTCLFPSYQGHDLVAILDSHPKVQVSRQRGMDTRHVPISGLENPNDMGVSVTTDPNRGSSIVGFRVYCNDRGSLTELFSCRVETESFGDRGWLPVKALFECRDSFPSATNPSHRTLVEFQWSTVDWLQGESVASLFPNLDQCSGVSVDTSEVQSFQFTEALTDRMDQTWSWRVVFLLVNVCIAVLLMMNYLRRRARTAIGS